MISMNDPRLRMLDETFVHTDTDGTVRCFAVGMVQRFIENNLLPVHDVAIFKHEAEFMARERGLEAHRLNRLTPEYRDKPVIFCEMSDDTYLLIDGHHRYVRRFLDGFSDITAHLLSETIWQHFLMDIPTDTETVRKLTTGHSMIG